VVQLKTFVRCDADAALQQIHGTILGERPLDVCEEDSAQGSFQVIAVEPHLAHIASANYLSPFEVLTAGFFGSGV
jgi:predicted NodU family carbamoyl transferase